jgi:hypothetical protein
MIRLIPDEPKIPLENYLLDLIEERDVKGRNIYIKNASEFVKEIWSEIVKTRRRLNVRKILPEKLSISCMGFYGYKNGRKAVSIQMLVKLLHLWQEFCDKSDDEVNKKWDSFFVRDLFFGTHSPHQEAVLPKFSTPKLAYLLGWICGDGNLNQYHNYVLKISEKSKPQLELVLKPLLYELFNVHAPIFRRSQNGYAIQIGSKPIFRFIANVLKIRVGEIPPYIENIDDDIKRYFLAGIFDAEGYVASSYLHSRVTISQANQYFLQKLIEFFKIFDIHFTGPNLHRSEKGVWFTIQLRKKSEILKFANQIGSYHVEKSSKLKELVVEIEKNWDS